MMAKDIKTVLREAVIQGKTSVSIEDLANQIGISMKEIKPEFEKHLRTSSEIPVEYKIAAFDALHKIALEGFKFIIQNGKCKYFDEYACEFLMKKTLGDDVYDTINAFNKGG